MEQNKQDNSNGSADRRANPAGGGAANPRRPNPSRQPPRARPAAGQPPPSRGPGSRISRRRIKRTSALPRKRPAPLPRNSSVRTVKRKVRRPRPIEQPAKNFADVPLYKDPPPAKQPLTQEQLEILNTSVRAEGGLFQTALDGIKSSKINATEYLGDVRLKQPMPALGFEELKAFGFSGIMLTDNGEIVRYGFNYPGLNGSAELQDAFKNDDYGSLLKTADKIRRGEYDTYETLYTLTPEEQTAVKKYLAVDKDIFNEAKKNGDANGKKTTASASFEVTPPDSAEGLPENQSLYVEDNWGVYTTIREILENLANYKRGLSGLDKMGFKTEDPDKNEAKETQSAVAVLEPVKEDAALPNENNSNDEDSNNDKKDLAEEKAEPVLEEKAIEEVAAKEPEPVKEEYVQPDMEAVITTKPAKTEVTPPSNEVFNPPPSADTIVIEIMPENIPESDRLAYPDIRQIANSLLDESVLIYSLPVPDKEGDKTIDCFFGIVPSGFDNSCEAPFGIYRIDTKDRRMLTTDMQTRPKRCHFRSRPFEEFCALEERYGTLYIKVRAFAFRPVLTQDEVISLSDFILTLKELEGEQLGEIYETAMPAFFNWLKTFRVE